MTFSDLQAVCARRDPDEMTETLWMLWGHLTMLTKVPKKRQRAVTKATRETWLTPIAEAYEREMGAGTFASLYGFAAKYLSPLREWYTDDEIAKRFGYYVRDLRRKHDERFFSLPRFAQQIATYNPDEPAFDGDD